ncbi:hypothetical protein Tco_0856821 [Tanacetum coccineum]|uniref:Uncharacterized protein n=1 Tax=Tanacetum coccineum TaxID=301880 RepID=A0ABQ5B8N7_9ASTR
MKSVSVKQWLPRGFSKKHRFTNEVVYQTSKGGSLQMRPSVQRDPLFDVMPEDTIDHMETKNAQSEGMTREMVDEDKEIDERILSTEDVLSTDKEGVSTDFEKVSTDRPIVSTDGSKVSTDRQIEGTNEQIEGTDEQVEGTEEYNEGTEEKNKGTEEIFEGTEEQKEGTEEKVEMSKKFSKLESDEELARKVQEEWEAEEERNRIAEENAANEDLIRDFDDIKARIEADRLLAEKLQEQEREQFTMKRKCKLIKKINEKGVDLSKSEVIKEESKEEVQEEDKDEESTRKRKLGTRKKHEREDLNAVYQLVMEKYQDEMPKSFDKVLWGDLMVIFNPDDENEFWSAQQDWKIKKKYPSEKNSTKADAVIGNRVERREEECNMALEVELNCQE